VRVDRLLVTAVVAACVACTPPARRPLTLMERAHVDECHAFAEETAPRVPVRASGGGGRSTVATAPNAESLQTLFELCMQAKGAMTR
jgi:hypothetical protein